MAQLAKMGEVESGRVSSAAAGEKATGEQLRELLQKRQREKEIREQLAAFAAEMERARERHAKLV